MVVLGCQLGSIGGLISSCSAPRLHLGKSWGCIGAVLGTLGALVRRWWTANSDPLGSLFLVVARPACFSGGLGAVLGGIGRSWGPRGTVLDCQLGPNGGLISSCSAPCLHLGRSWDRLGAVLGALGTLLVCFWKVLGRFWAANLGPLRGLISGHTLKTLGGRDDKTPFFPYYFCE